MTDISKELSMLFLALRLAKLADNNENFALFRSFYITIREYESENRNENIKEIQE